MTVRRYVVGMYLAHVHDPWAVTHHDVQAFLDTRPISTTSRLAYLSHVKAFYRWAILDERATVDPTARIAKPKPPRRLPRPAPLAAIEHAIALATPDMRAMLALAAFQGFRCQEIAGLQTADVMWGEPPMLRVSAGKGGRERMMPMAHETERALRALTVPDVGPVFVSVTGIAHTPDACSGLINRHLRRCGVPYTAHTLRHHFGTWMWRTTKDLRLTQDLLGHASPQTTQIYTAFDDTAAVAALRPTVVA